MIDIIFEDNHYIAINKLPGYHVHPPENSIWKVPKDRVCLYLVRNYLNSYVYPIHRLDAATGGVLIYAKTSEAAAKFQAIIQNQSIIKKYLSVVRGYTAENGIIDTPLLSDSSDKMLSSKTEFKRLKTIELPFAVGKKYSTTRYSLVEAEPKTGRYHQIRRHFASQSHPIIGDIMHGDSHHNRFFRTQLKNPGLFLHSFELNFNHPYTNELIKIKSLWSERWIKIFELFDYDLNSFL